MNTLVSSWVGAFDSLPVIFQEAEPKRVGPDPTTVMVVTIILLLIGIGAGFALAVLRPRSGKSATTDDSERSVATTKSQAKNSATADRIETSERDTVLRNEIELIRAEVEDAQTLADDGSLIEAKDQLKRLKPRLVTAEETAHKYGYRELIGEIEGLSKQRKDSISEITGKLQAKRIPDTIPRAPDISVNYETLAEREPIGGGGNADVWKGMFSAPEGDITLAIKEPRLSETLQIEQIERILQEAETWDRLDDHDHVVGVIDYGSEPLPWIAMEYMDSGHLGKRMSEMDYPQALWTAIAVTKAVRHAHRKGVAHLDLKPKNILFRTIENAWDVPKVADWGLSKHLLEHSKSVEGLSPEYAAPEQFSDEYGHTDDITDVYQLGAVFYELFTGQTPFKGDPAKAMHRVLNKQPTLPSEIGDVPEELDEILLTALAKEKDDRYDDIVYLRDDLQEFFDEL